MKIILTVILSLCWKLQNVPLPINGYFKSQITSRKIAGSAYGKHILTSDNSSSQHNTKPHSLMKTWLPSPRKISSRVLRERDGFQRESSGHEQGWQEVTALNDRWQSKQHQRTVSSAFKRNQNHMSSYRREESG